MFAGSVVVDVVVVAAVVVVVLGVVDIKILGLRNGPKIFSKIAGYDFQHFRSRPLWIQVPLWQRPMGHQYSNSSCIKSSASRTTSMHSMPSFKGVLRGPHSCRHPICIVFWACSAPLCSSKLEPSLCV
uniref:Putative secreted protein n=1 Tax=Amblyomma cajennense TaxID=34607 RepID=A0A023FE10_AMBCJ